MKHKEIGSKKNWNKFTIDYHNIETILFCFTKNN